jgi:glycerol-3-phosphate acyltransferase PlsY
MAAGVGYLVGSLPWADLAARRVTGGQVDLRAAGSGNPGALNAIEILGKRWGVAVGLADVAKGVTASVVGRALGGDVGAHVGGTAAVVGHCYPVWSNFRGGKGVACVCGQCIATFPAAVPIEIAAAAVGMVGPFERRSHTTTVLLTTTWVAAGLVWWVRRWPNWWGPTPTVALPIAAAASSAVVRRRFADEQRAAVADDDDLGMGFC